MDIQDIRRTQLRRWVERNGTPQKEKSYFSQLLGGSSFGERAARRLEKDYGMDAGYLDEMPDVQPDALSGSTGDDQEWLTLIRRLTPEQRATFKICFEALGKSKEVPKDHYRVAGGVAMTKAKKSG